MDAKKINLATMQNKLSRAEMKALAGGSQDPPGCPGILSCGTVEVGEKCPDVGDSKGCTCRHSSDGNYCDP